LVLLGIGAISYVLAVEQGWAADCVDLSTREPITVSGLLEHRTFSPAVDGENATEGVFPESAYLLQLDTARCFVSHEFLDGEVDVKRIQLIVNGDDDRGLFSQLRALKGRYATVAGEPVSGGDSSHRHALVAVVVSSVSSNQEGELLSATEGELNVMEPDGGPAGLVPEMEPSDPTTTTAIEPQDAAIHTVESFYLALAAGDGDEAAQNIIPSKRRSGPLSAKEMSSFYGSLKRPLQLLGVRPIGGGRYEASYTFETWQGMRCNGQSVVTTIPVEGDTLISRIVAESGC
jgi:hypothetical protein